MTNIDPNFKRQVEKLHRLRVYARWMVVIVSWLTLGLFGIWGLREEIALWREYFTWAAVRFAIVYNRIPSFALGFCFGITTSVLVWQSSNILRGGISSKERHRLEKMVKQIRQSGPSHPLWKWVCK